MGVKKDHLAQSIDVPVRQVVIENPIINSPFDEPTRHFRFSDKGITNEIDNGRRPSSYFVPIAKPKKKGSGQLQFDTEWTQDRIEENKLVNDIRRRIALWRKGRYVGVTPTTARLIAYWTDANREKKLFFSRTKPSKLPSILLKSPRSTGMPG
jgi:type III restriction enzyme